VLHPGGKDYFSNERIALLRGTETHSKGTLLLRGGGKLAGRERGGEEEVREEEERRAIVGKERRRFDNKGKKGVNRVEGKTWGRRLQKGKGKERSSWGILLADEKSRLFRAGGKDSLEKREGYFSKTILLGRGKKDREKASRRMFGSGEAQMGGGKSVAFSFHQGKVLSYLEKEAREKKGLSARKSREPRR